LTAGDFKEIATVLGAIGGVLSTIASYFIVRARGASAAALKTIDVSAEWQSQMLARISSVEAELQRERARGDLLEAQLFAARSEARELEWKVAREQNERISLSNEVHKMRAENATLQKQNSVLAAELHELNSQIRSGHLPLLSTPPEKPAVEPPPVTPPFKPRLPRGS
jgi:septal ring factor EnvC (AmiA/AmiB activator)